jgi:16S rRNA (uracil1498-N3)-methyltransferase
VNLLLLAPGEIVADEALVGGRRAEHVLGLLNKQPGEKVRVGVLGEGTCAATVGAVDTNAGQVRLLLGERTPQPAPRTSLVLALPRPKALSRIVQLAASFGVLRLDLVGTHKVDPAYFSSPRLDPARLDEDALLGLEQGGLVHLPIFAIHRSLGAYVREQVDVAQARVVFHPGGAGLLGSLVSDFGPESPVTLAFGPDGGFLPAEIELLRGLGFRPMRLSTSILRTEVAVAAGLGQLELVRRLAVPMAEPS